jgi:hypothetical protein
MNGRRRSRSRPIWERRSNRQGRKVTLGALVGEMEIEGNLDPLAPLTAEILHVGKGATFGLGRIEIEAPGSSWALQAAGMGCLPFPGHRPAASALGWSLPARWAGGKNRLYCVTTV